VRVRGVESSSPSPFHSVLHAGIPASDPAAPGTSSSFPQSDPWGQVPQSLLSAPPPTRPPSHVMEHKRRRRTEHLDYSPMLELDQDSVNTMMGSPMAKADKGSAKMKGPKDKPGGSQSN